MPNIIALYKNARDVVRAENLCRRAGIAITIHAVPERYSSECGMCMYFDVNDRDNFSKLMANNNIIVRYEEI